MKKKIIIVGIALVCIVVAVAIMANYQSIIKTVTPPSPVVISTHADGTSSKLFDYSMKVEGVVTNTGGDGFVVIEATAYQNNSEWVKTIQIYMQSYETSEFVFEFDEVKLLTAEPTYNVATYAL